MTRAAGTAAAGTAAAGGAAVAEAARRVVHHPLSVAPMMDWTDRHFRYLLRQVTRSTLLYTEMLHAKAVLHGNRGRLLDFDATQHPIALQLGGDDASELAEAARIGADHGYDEINLNVGCPSERVASGNFGACLMLQPTVVARAVEAMREAVAIPVTVKHRIGVDHADSYEDMERFVQVVAAAGADAFTVHARKAWLHGLSPKENRNVPPLRYQDVYRLKRAFPALVIELNGGVRDLESAAVHLRQVDGVMLGRSVYEDPFVLADADARFYRPSTRISDMGSHAAGVGPRAPVGGVRAPGEAPAGLTREQVVRAMLPYVEDRLTQGEPLMAVARHMLSSFRGLPGGKQWRRHISEHAHLEGAGVEVLERALERLPQASRLATGPHPVEPLPTAPQAKPAWVVSGAESA